MLRLCRSLASTLQSPAEGVIIAIFLNSFLDLVETPRALLDSAIGCRDAIYGVPTADPRIPI